MKKIILSTLLLLLILNIKVNAQDQHQKEPITESKKLDNILEKLQLDEERTAEFKILYHQRQEEIKAERKENLEQKAALQEKRDELRESHRKSLQNYNEKLSNFLDTEELQQLQDYQKSMTKDGKQNSKRNHRLKEQNLHHQYEMKEQAAPSKVKNIRLTE